MRRDRITIYRADREGGGGWRWQWKAGNGRIIGASTEGYAAKRDCLVNLERVTGGVFEVIFQTRDVRSGDMYQQGELRLTRFDARETLFVDVLP